ncbi:MAG: hypothetical protein M0027_13405 [Candidatus Dormibacteraeota bacterium]|nr:hypothetical protein [Candidatus Dormibacteraeota bacterium]
MASPEPIFLLAGGSNLVELVEQPYDKEEILQELLATHPRLLESVSRPDGAGRWLLIEREAQLPSSAGGPNRWSIDHLFVDSAGVPTIVEVKRSSNTQIRREVVGQMLDYAANAVVYWPVDSLVAKFEGTARKRGLEPDTELEHFLGSDAEPAAFWEKVKTNLEAAKVRLVFVADAIPPELQRIVEFLNEQMISAEVLAVEVRQFKWEQGTVLVPRLIGRTASAEALKSSSSGQRDWDRTAFLDELRARCGDDRAEAARTLMDWSLENGASDSFGHGASEGSWWPTWKDSAITCSPIKVWTYGRVEIQFEQLKSLTPFDNLELRAELARLIERVSGETIPDDKLGKRPSFSIEALCDATAMSEFESVLEWTREKYMAQGSRVVSEP